MALESPSLTGPTASLAQALHDLAHPDETHLRAGSMYRTMAERLIVELHDGGGDLYKWLTDRARGAGGAS